MIANWEKIIIFAHSKNALLKSEHIFARALRCKEGIIIAYNTNI